MSVTRRILGLLVILCMLQFLTACPWRMAGEDAKKGAAVGFAIGGPQGGAIGFITMGLLSLVLRHGEKKYLRKRGLLTDRIQRKSPALDKPAPSGEYPQQHIGH